jgi:nucleoside-triphosphatase THEP1
MLVVLRGGRDSGKTSLCRELATTAQARGFAAGGVVSPGVFSALGEKTGFLCEELSGGASWLQGSRAEALAGPVYRAFTFSAAGFERANAACLAFLGRSDPGPAGLFILDEVGPLELDYGEGFRPALDGLAGGPVRPALITVRPELAGRLSALFSGWPSRVVEASKTREAGIWEFLLSEKRFRG